MLLKDLVKKYRLSRKWQQRDLAARVGVSQNYISKIELGQAVPRSRKFREQLLSVLGLPRVRLLEAYAESKLSRDEALAFRNALHRDFQSVGRGELITREEELLLQAFAKLGREQRREILELIGFKLRRPFAPAEDPPGQGGAA